MNRGLECIVDGMSLSGESQKSPVMSHLSGLGLLLLLVIGVYLRFYFTYVYLRCMSRPFRKKVNFTIQGGAYESLNMYLAVSLVTRSMFSLIYVFKPCLNTHCGDALLGVLDMQL